MLKNNCGVNNQWTGMRFLRGHAVCGDVCGAKAGRRVRFHGGWLTVFPPGGSANLKSFLGLFIGPSFPMQKCSNRLFLVWCLHLVKGGKQGRKNAKDIKVSGLRDSFFFFFSSRIHHSCEVLLVERSLVWFQVMGKLKSFLFALQLINKT